MWFDLWNEKCRIVIAICGNEWQYECMHISIISTWSWWTLSCECSIVVIVVILTPKWIMFTCHCVEWSTFDVERIMVRHHLLACSCLCVFNVLTSFSVLSTHHWKLTQTMEQIYVNFNWYKFNAEMDCFCWYCCWMSREGSLLIWSQVRMVLWMLLIRMVANQCGWSEY